MNRRYHFFLPVTFAYALTGCQLVENPFAVADNVTSEQQIITYDNHHPNNQDTVADLTHEAKNTSQISQHFDNSPITFADALDFVLKNSGMLRAARADLRAKRLQAEALQSLHRPAISLSANTGYYKSSGQVSTEKLRDRVGDFSIIPDNVSQNLPTGIQSLLGKLPTAGDIINNRISDEVDFERDGSFGRVGVNMIMPLYTGGRIDAIKQISNSRADLQKEEVEKNKEELVKQLIQRYFMVQLAQHVREVRTQAVKAVKAHDYAAKRMLEVGLISVAERLQGEAALADAEFQLQKADDDVRLAQRALDSLLYHNNVTPENKLFVNHAPFESLDHYQVLAQKKYHAFATIDAKEKQVQAVKTMNDASLYPTLSALGTAGISSRSRSWSVGINANWVVQSSIDRKKMQQASSEYQKQIDAVRLQAQKDVNLLVQKTWQTVNDSVSRFDALAKEEKLAKEVLRLRKAGFKEGLNTVIEVNDAQAKLTKSKTLRAKAAYDYIVALSELLSATGELETFNNFITKADTRL